MNRTASLFLVSTLTVALLLGTVVTVSATNADAESDEAVRESIEQLEQQYHDAVMKRDGRSLDRLLSADFTIEGNQALARAEFLDQVQGTIPPKAQTIDSMSVKLHGKTAVVTGVATSEWVSPAGARTDSFRWVNVWVRGDDGWQVLYSQTNTLGKGMPGDGC